MIPPPHPLRIAAEQLEALQPMGAAAREKATEKEEPSTRRALGSWMHPPPGPWWKRLLRGCRLYG